MKCKTEPCLGMYITHYDGICMVPKSIWRFKSHLKMYTVKYYSI